MTTYRIRHSTRYEYELPVTQAHHLAHLRPRGFDSQRVGATKIETKPASSHSSRVIDYFGNESDQLEVITTHDAFEVTMFSEVEVLPRPLAENPPADPTSWDEVITRLETSVDLVSLREFCFDSPLVRAHPSLRKYAEPTFAPGRPLIDAVQELNHRIFTEFKYEPAATDITTPLAQVLREKRGVCQDFAHLAVGCLRSLGLAARYVSGYLETVPPEGQKPLAGADASHAWASVLLPNHGWLDFDPTNDLLPSERHITVAWGRDFSDVSPLKGVVLGGGKHRLAVGVDVEAA